MRRKIFENLIGKKFGLLVVESFDERRKYRDYWRCKCFCGNYLSVTSYHLKKMLSCGCKKKSFLNVGDKFGMLTILGDFKHNKHKGGYQWLCKCDCGIEKYFYEYYLRSPAKNKCCGCMHRRLPRKMLPRCREVVDLSGKRIGKLVVSKSTKIVGNSVYWLCECSCGNKKYLAESYLRYGKPHSCGCENIIKASNKYVGKKFENLTVVSFQKKDRGNIYWKCHCDCGNYTIVATNKLGVTKSCGCAWKKAVTKHGLHGKPGYMKYLLRDPIRKLKHHISGSIRTVLKSNNHVKGGKTFDYLPYTAEELKSHLESLWEPWMNWDNYGENLKSKRKTWHIDHIVQHNKFKYQKLGDLEFLECWSLKNLRPLEKYENARRKKK